MKKGFAFPAALFVFFSAMAVLQAAALDNTRMGAKANIMGRAFTGLADDPSAVFYNPAGLVFQREGVSLQSYGVYTRTSLWYYGPEADTVSGSTEKADTVSRSTEKVIQPEIFINYHDGDIAFGLGVYTPYGSNAFKYDSVHSVPGRSIEQNFSLTAMSASFAYRLADVFSLGLSLSAYHGRYAYSGLNLFGDPGNQKHDFSGMAGVGGNIGALFKANDALSFGLTLKAPVKVSIGGDASFTAAGVGTDVYTGRAEFTTPLYITFGTALHTNPQGTLTLTFDFNYAFYSKLKNYTFILRDVQNPGATTVKNKETGYTDAVYAAIGIDGRASEKLSVRGGIHYAPTATSDEGLTWSCDLSRITEGFGLAYAFTPEFEFMLSFQMFQFFGFRRSVIKPPDAIFSDPYEEKYFHNGLMLTAGVNYGFTF
jgi:long-chain fatty acid transport protein